MNTQIIFFDIDETLCRNGVLANNSKAVLRDLSRKTDIKIVIATGRGSVMLPRDIRDFMSEGLTDAVICSNGQFNMFHDDHVLTHYPLESAKVAEFVRLCEHFGIGYQQLSKDFIACSRPLPKGDMIGDNFADVCIIDPEHYRHNDIYQFSVLLTEDEEHLHREYTEAFDELGFHFTRWKKGGADILPNGVSKVQGINDVCRHFNIGVENTMAFGDGLNDIEMLQHVAVGVAMGDAWPQLQTVADFVTDTIEGDGIRKALQRYSILN